MSVEIIHGDVLSADIDPKQYHSAICDPPYSERVHRDATSQSPKGGTRHRDLGFVHLSDALRSRIAEFVAGVSKWSLVYSDVEGLHLWHEECQKHGATYIRTLPWCRWSMPNLAGDRPPQGFETISVFWGTQRGRKSWNGPGNLVSLNHTCLRGALKHRAEKPLDQALDLVTWFTNPGERVLDPCAGSGTVGLACRLLGRDYVGYEIDPVWAEKAQERLARETLSDRDQERYTRWLASQEVAKADAERRRQNTERQRAKMEAARGR